MIMASIPSQKEKLTDWILLVFMSEIFNWRWQKEPDANPDYINFNFVTLMKASQRSTRSLLKIRCLHHIDPCTLTRLVWSRQGHQITHSVPCMLTLLGMWQYKCLQSEVMIPSNCKQKYRYHNKKWRGKRSSVQKPWLQVLLEISSQ